ncbi:MAG: DUF3443 family protein [Actinomycetes bacterium]
MNLGIRPRSAVLAIGGLMVMGLVLTSCSQTGQGQSGGGSVSNPVCGQPPPALGSGGSPVSVPITVLGTPIPEVPTVKVAVGNSAPVPVLLDTGSVGLRVFSQRLPNLSAAGVSVTGTPVVETYEDGSVFNGHCATATVKIGDAATATEVPFQLVDSVTCASFRPNCPKPELANGTAGIMGIGLYPKDVPNPLEYLAGSLAGSWSVHLSSATGSLNLGAADPANSAASFNLTSQGSVGPVPAWDGHTLNVCWSVKSAAPVCDSTLFDSGAVDMNWWDPVLAQSVGVTATPAGTPIPAGLPVTLSTSSGASPFWSFTTGTQPGVNQVFAQVNPFPGPNSTLASTGMAIYRQFTVTYNLSNGTIKLN